MDDDSCMTLGGRVETKKLPGTPLYSKIDYQAAYLVEKRVESLNPFIRIR